MNAPAIPGTDAPRDGGAAARRAVMRWAIRMFRREWRRQLLVMGLLAFAVAAATGFGIVAYELAAAAGSADFGDATHFIRLGRSEVNGTVAPGTDAAPAESEALSADIAAAREWFEAIDVIGHRAVAVPGRFQPVEYRVQDPDGALGGPLLDLLSGRYPVGDGEAAVTDGVAGEFAIEVGTVLDLDGTTRVVVGIVENPSDLGDEFALMAPTAGAPLDWVTVLVDADGDRVGAFRVPSGQDLVIGARSGGEAVYAALGVLGITVVALLLVGLLASVGFVVIAQRRRRQLGMLAAVGASRRHLRIALVANGTVAGALAAGAGAAVGVAGWLLAQPGIESAVGYRVSRFALPWWLIVAVVVLGVLAATGAASWPARQASGASIVGALSGRPTRPRPVHRSAVLAVTLVLAGVVGLLLAGDVADERAVHRGSLALVVAGTVAAVVGVLLVSPLAVRALASLATPLPVAGRLALRDLARFQSRSAAAVAAIALALGIAVATVVASTAAVAVDAAGNLAERQLLVRTEDSGGPFIPDADRLPVLESRLEQMVATLDGAGVIPLLVAHDPDVENSTSFEGRVAATLARRVDDGWGDLSLLYIATAQVLALQGLDIDVFASGTDIVSGETGDLAVLGVVVPDGVSERAPVTLTDVGEITPLFSSLPGTFITVEGLEERGLEAVDSGTWLIELSRPATEDELAAVRVVVAGSGLTVESRDHQRGLSNLRAGATAVGVLLALGVLAMTVGLIRAESAGDLATLTATGAGSTIRRAIVASTAGALAMLGVVLGTGAAFGVLAAGYLDDVVTPASRAGGQLVLIALGTPLAAAAAGWLLAGRERSSIARQPLE
ncbi:MAG TPA: FtsX-like permease family protein [Acidimicrobiia bacterium]